DATLTNGVGTFTIYLRTAGDHTVTVTDPFNLLTAVSDPVTVVHAAATRLQITLPAPVTAGNPVTVLFAVADDFGNVASDTTATFEVTTSPLGTIVSGPTPGNNGTATITYLFRAAGSETIAAVDDAHLLATATTTFTVNPGPAASLSITTPDSAAVGVPF